MKKPSCPQCKNKKDVVPTSIKAVSCDNGFSLRKVPAWLCEDCATLFLVDRNQQPAGKAKK